MGIVEQFSYGLTQIMIYYKQVWLKIAIPP